MKRATALSLVLACGSLAAFASAAILANASEQPRTTTPAATKPAAAATKDIVDTAVAAGSFKTLAAALQAAGLVEALKGAGPFTVFAPTDEAFAKLPEGTVETLLKPENKAKLQQILKYHVVAAKATSSDVAGLSYAMTLAGQRVDLKSAGGKVMVDGATVLAADVMASNGVIHVIDRVILPADKNIVETASAAGSFSTLLAAAKAAGLAETLSGPGPFTVFAPTDEAFAKLPAGTVEGLLKPENRETLRSILLFHVVPGAVYADQAAKLTSATTAQGGSFAISAKDGKVKVGNSKGMAAVAAADIETSNGVIHVIDAVILPE